MLPSTAASYGVTPLGRPLCLRTYARTMMAAGAWTHARLQLDCMRALKAIAKDTRRGGDPVASRARLDRVNALYRSAFMQAAVIVLRGSHGRIAQVLRREMADRSLKQSMRSSRCRAPGYVDPRDILRLDEPFYDPVVAAHAAHAPPALLFFDRSALKPKQFRLEGAA